jgi:hypothetical protein
MQHIVARGAQTGDIYIDALMAGLTPTCVAVIYSASGN